MAAHFVEAAVNVRTGEDKLRRFHAYQDCGTPINPSLAIGQIYGGVMKAIGHSLYEELLFDDEGRPLNLNFTDYKIPSIYEVPDDFHVELVPVGRRDWSVWWQERVGDIAEQRRSGDIDSDTRCSRCLVPRLPIYGRARIAGEWASYSLFLHGTSQKRRSGPADAAM